jgi:hypothetical protein
MCNFVKLFIIFFIPNVISYGNPPPPPPPCNTPQCSSGTFCYSNTNQCETCPIGYRFNSNPNVGVSNVNLWGCTICPSGTFSSNSGSSICSKCNIGTFQNAVGQSSCKSCPSNTFSSNTGASLCTSCSTCSSNKYVANPCSLSSDVICNSCTNIANCASPITCTSISNSVCTSCITGTYLESNQCKNCYICLNTEYEIFPCTFTTNRQCTSCTNICPIGQMLQGSCIGTSNPICIQCPSGHYKSIADGSNCIQCTNSCPVGFYLDQPCTNIRNPVCIQCPSGHYKSIADGSNCIKCTNSCPVGFYLDQPCTNIRNSICIECPTGYYKSIADGSNCIGCTNSCPIGFELDQLCTNIRNPICIQCSSGYYKSIADGSNCIGCTNSCPIGFELDQPCTNIRNPVCINCQNGYYKSVSDDTSCILCNTDCGAGSYLTTYCNSTSNPSCALCPANTANPNTGSVFILSCINCPNGAISAPGSATCLQCPFGTATFNTNVCSNCLVGTYADTKGSIVCKLCPSGTATNQIGSINIIACRDCLLGTYAEAGQAMCTACPIGSYGINTTSVNDCLSCPSGTYNNLLGQINCTNCPSGTFSNITNSNNSNSCIKCPPGSYSNEGSNLCTLCPPGTSSIIDGANSCIYNLPGTFTITNGSLNAILCNPGTYSDAYGSHICTNCSYGTFNPVYGSSSITSCIKCPIGSYQNNSGSHICLSCPIGSYQNMSGQPMCVKCSPGTFNTNTDSTSSDACINCPTGSYQNYEGSSICIGCPVGTYNDLVKMSACNSCPMGTYNNNTNSVNIIDCKKCPVGSFSNMLGGISIDVCIQTPLGTFTNNTGSPNYTVCPTGTFQDNVGMSYCKKCQLGTFNSLYGAYSNNTCIKAKPGYFVDTFGSDNPTPCNMGSYSNINGSIICERCQPGTFTNKLGSTICDTCLLGTYAVGSGFANCNTIGKSLINISNMSAHSVNIILTTNFTTSYPFEYICMSSCNIFINNILILSHRNNTSLQYILLDVILGTDKISISFDQSFQIIQELSWDCINSTYCETIIPNIVIQYATLIIWKDIDSIYSNPNITFNHSINITSLTQEYIFNIDNLEAYVNYFYKIELNIINTTIPYIIINSNFTTSSDVPMGSVRNLVKYFIGINSIEHANNEQSKLQIHWDPPLIWLSQGPIISYKITYISSTKTYITYGPNVNFITIPSIEKTIYTNQFTLIISQLMPDTIYSFTVYPMTDAIGTGPGASIILKTQVSAPPKPPIPTLLAQEPTNIIVSWPSLTNETGIITKAWIIAEPYEGNMSTSFIVELSNRTDLDPLPFPNIGINGFFTHYNVSNQCESHLHGYTFKSIISNNICGGLCKEICEFGTPMLDPNTILPTNDQTLFNDNYRMNFIDSNNNTLTRLVPYLTMKKRFNLSLSDGGLNLGGKVVIGDGKINPNSLLNNTLLNSSLSYRIRLIVFTSEVLYAISDSLEIPPFQFPSTIDLTTSIYIGIIISISILIFCIIICNCIKKKGKIYNNKITQIDNNNNNNDLAKIKMNKNVDTKYLDVSIINEPKYFDPFNHIENKYLEISKNDSIETIESITFRYLDTSIEDTSIEDIPPQLPIKTTYKL